MAAARPSADAASMMVIRPQAAFSALSTVPVNAASAPPPALVRAAETPEALPASPGRTAMHPALALGMVMPLPIPTQAQAPNRISWYTCPEATSSSPIASPPHAMRRPAIITVVSSYRAENRPARKLPNMKPAVMLPI